MGVEIYELLDPKITALQEAYVRKVVDTVNEFDNVLYEISNENHPPSNRLNFAPRYGPGFPPPKCARSSVEWPLSD